MADAGAEQPRPAVLVVDDRPQSLLAIEAMLEGLPVRVVGVGSGEAALKALLRDDFALILMDAQMPAMDGFETASRIKQRERTRTVPIVFLIVAEDDAHAALRGYAVGAVDYVTKPVDPWVLRAKVSVLVELWHSNRRARVQAALTARYQRRLSAAAETVDRCLAVVNDGHGDRRDVGEVATMLGQLADELRQ